MLYQAFPRLLATTSSQLPYLMGVVNITPDSYTDGGKFFNTDKALAQALQSVEAGASFIDLGAESTRPGASPISSQEELDRLLPVLEKLRANSDVLISIDTSNPQLMLEAAKLGANLLNDVRSFTREGALAAAVSTGLPLCIMHMRGEPSSMQQLTEYENVTQEVKSWLANRMQELLAAGVAQEKILLDPGFGFAKLLPHNLQLLAELSSLAELGQPLLVGMSRKSMLGELTGKEPLARDPAGLAAHLLAAQQGAAILRVHNVDYMADALKVWRAVEEANKA